MRISNVFRKVRELLGEEIEQEVVIQEEAERALFVLLNGLFRLQKVQFIDRHTTGFTEKTPGTFLVASVTQKIAVGNFLKKKVLICEPNHEVVPRLEKLFRLLGYAVEKRL